MTARSRSGPGPAPLDLLARPEPLRWHAALAAVAACAAILANLLISPSRLWAPWLALALGAALAAHGALVLARAMRPAAPAEHPDTGEAAASAAAARRLGAEPWVDPGPPIFPDEPAAPVRRWIPRQPAGPAPEPRIAAFPAPRIRPLPTPLHDGLGDGRGTIAGMAAESGTPRAAPLWPVRDADAPPAPLAGDDPWATARAAFPGGHAAEQDSAAAGW